ncbi:PREDICTED: laminin subunit beta-2-like [Elephantulus edwardii]|uniref:laminin subunit beta-2-like n=1 Tax=Elephantulus edwardii TaxID=28737 RepID=UPI0003F09B75|nr:PREDICTED: laminin subunit beta-2-like [Elephantulus edwardii]
MHCDLFLFKFCSSGSCYPPTGNLLIGRGQRLNASSTCGRRGPEPYCVVTQLQDSENCYFCDPGAQRGHSIENVISWSSRGGKKTWWQAESGVENVTIQLDLEAAFYFTHLVMTFKTFRPAALLLERSVDHGYSWHLYRYFAHNCSGLFPGVPPAPGRRLSDIVCDQHYSDIEPSTEGKVIFEVLDPAIEVEDPNSPEIQELLHITNIRVNFSKLHTLGDRPLRSLKGHPFYYYAIYELVVQGSCLCHGHASECRPAPGASTNTEGMVHAHCVCRHHTAGANCERCQALYQDHPWHAAEPGHPHPCKKCECHGHARSCHFDMALYLASGNVSGGVCDACQHNTAGRHCQLCRPFFYRDPQEDPRSPRSCRSCNCDPEGTLEGGLCDTHTDETRGLLSGQCRCKDHVWGPRCESCRPGHYGLNTTQSEGCQPCRCDSRGRVPGTHACDPSSGTCHCKRFVSGRDCSRCLPEFWGLSSDPPGCRPCDCDFGGVLQGKVSACAALTSVAAAAMNSSQGISVLAWIRPQLKLNLASISSQLTPGCLEPLGPLLLTVHKPEGPLPAGSSPGFGDSVTLDAPADPRSQDQSAGPVLWNVSNFARVADGAGLFLLAPAVPRALEYDIVLRYEIQVVLLPRVEELPGMRLVDPGAMQRLHELRQAGCMELARMGPSSTMSEACTRLVCSISALLHGGGLECSCHAEGATSAICNPQSGQCPCRAGLAGRRCDHCLPGRWGFPHCHPCACNGHAELCHPLTGICQDCQGATTGRHCERCQDGYYGDPVLGSGQQCRPCPCPGYPGSGLYYGSSCHMDNMSGRVLCLCVPGYAVDAASAVFTTAMALAVPTASLASMAVPCAQGAAGVSGQCLCRPHTLGRDCNRCAPLFWNLGGPQGCEPCDCHTQHALRPVCHPVTGQCPCRPGFGGRTCSQCRDGYWGDPEQECRACACDPQGSISPSCDPHRDEGADVASIELVAWDALEVPLLQGEPTGVAHLLDQIQGYLPAPGAVGQEVHRAEGILEQALQTREGTAKVLDQMLDVQGALAKVGSHTRAAEQGFQLAKQALRRLEASVQEAAGQMALAVDVTPVLGHLFEAAKALRMCLALNQQQAQDAEEWAVRAAGITGGLGKDLQVAWLGMAELQEGTSGLVTVVQDTKVRIHHIQAEAQELLKRTQSIWNRLERLEHRLVHNERTLSKKAATLQALEQRAMELLEYMRLGANIYATC